MKLRRKLRLMTLFGLGALYDMFYFNTLTVAYPVMHIDLIEESMLI